MLRRFLGRLLLELTADWVGYECMLDFIEREHLMSLEGDILEIGAFVGGGTRKLAKLAARFGKKVFAIDVFDPSVDDTTNVFGRTMRSLYDEYLGNLAMTQYEAYRYMTGRYRYITTMACDSMNLRFQPGQEFVFSFIDGNHSPVCVRHDFQLAWNHTVSGGAVALHDYGGDLPQVTATIDSLKIEHASQIAETKVIPSKLVIVFTKR
jgi:SAM-dependent methyltransferase